MKRRIFITLTLFVFCFSTSFAQTKIEEKKSCLVAEINYVTNSVWQGRSDSIITSGIGVSLGYHFKFGLYVDGGLTIIPNRQVDLLDLTTIKAGYEFSIIKDVFGGNVAFIKNFYSQYSTQVGSEVQGGVVAELSYDFDLVQLAVSSEYSYGTKNDIGLTSALSKNIEIELSKDHTLSLTPTITGYAGTQNLYALYLINRPKKANRGKNSHASSTTTVTQEVEYSKFNMLDLDVSLPITYAYKKFTFGITPTMAFPLNVQTGEFTSRPFFVNFSVAFKL